MGFDSILFRGTDDPIRCDTPDAPVFFHDLNLDQIVQAITTGWEDYDLAPFFHTPLNDLDAIAYRQEAMRDFEDKSPMQTTRLFSRRMRGMREHLHLAKKLYDTYHKQGWFLATVGLYCEAVEHLSQDLAELHLASHGMRAFREFLIVMNEIFSSTTHQGCDLLEQEDVGEDITARPAVRPRHFPR